MIDWDLRSLIHRLSNVSTPRQNKGYWYRSYNDSACTCKSSRLPVWYWLGLQKFLSKMFQRWYLVRQITHTFLVFYISEYRQTAELSLLGPQREQTWKHSRLDWWPNKYDRSYTFTQLHIITTWHDRYVHAVEVSYACCYKFYLFLIHIN